MLYSNYLDFELMSSQQFVLLGIAITVSVFAGILIGTSMNPGAQTLDRKSTRLNSSH